MNILALILFPLIVLIFGMLSGYITAKKIPTWYKFLVKPPLTPPNWIFGPAWTILFLMIGLSGFFIYEELSDLSFSLPWSIYFLQLILNFIWTPLFFGLNYLLISGIEIIILEVTIIANIWLFIQVNLIAGLLLIPYSIWVGFASYLNWGFWWLNREKETGRKEIDLGVKEKLRNNE